MATRVVQWTTGNVGRRSVRAVLAHPELDLVGCYAWSSDKVGRDVGELCGLDPVGVTATDDVDVLLALQPDCVVYTPMWPDVDELVRILEADWPFNEGHVVEIAGRPTIRTTVQSFPHPTSKRPSRTSWSSG
jgi:hypothetical protein